MKAISIYFYLISVQKSILQRNMFSVSWLAIAHARNVETPHKLKKLFLDYGDLEDCESPQMDHEKGAL